MQKILLVEDSEQVRALVAQILQISGFNVIEAGNGINGLKAAKKELPDLIISDCNMPEMDGMELLEKIRKNKSTAGIPFIFLSGNLSAENIIRGKELGVTTFLTKPFNPEELLLSIINSLTDKG